MTFEFKANSVTGKQEASFTAKLVSDAPKSLLTYQNASGATKEYGIVSVEFEDAKGNKVVRSAGIAKANLDHGITKGESYLCRVTVDGTQAYISMSHLQGAVLASADDFGFIGVAQTTQVNSVLPVGA